MTRAFFFHLGHAEHKRSFVACRNRTIVKVATKIQRIQRLPSKRKMLGENGPGHVGAFNDSATRQNGRITTDNIRAYGAYMRTTQHGDHRPLRRGLVILMWERVAKMPGR